MSLVDPRPWLLVVLLAPGVASAQVHRPPPPIKVGPGPIHTPGPTPGPIHTPGPTPGPIHSPGPTYTPPGTIGTRPSVVGPGVSAPSAGPSSEESREEVARRVKSALDHFVRQQLYRTSEVVKARR
jgi:hypothetical protein